MNNEMDSIDYSGIKLTSTRNKSKYLMRMKSVKLLKRYNVCIVSFKDKFKKVHKRVVKTSKINTYNDDLNNNDTDNVADNNPAVMSLKNERTVKNNLDVFEGINENIIKIIKIYLKRCLFKDCKLVSVNKSYIEDIVELVFNPCITAKKYHFTRDILDLITIQYITEPMLHKFNVKRGDKLFLFKGFCFFGHTTHFPNNIIKHAENYIPYHISTLLSRYNVICISNVGNLMINKLSYAFKCNILDSIISSITHSGEDLENNPAQMVVKNQLNMPMADLSMYMGICEECNIIENKKSMVFIRFLDYFKGFTVLISTHLMSSEILKTVKELIKITLIRLQAIIEELQFINNLKGTVTVNRALNNVIDDNTQICENFSDYLLKADNITDYLVDSPKVNSAGDTDIVYYGNMINSSGSGTVSAVEYRKVVKLTLYKYYTNNNQTCGSPERVYVSVGNFNEGNFLVNFLQNLRNCLKINKCPNLNCSEPFLNHQLHYETSYSNTHNMKLTLTFQHATHNFTTLDNYNEDDVYNHGIDSEINMDIYCMKCNSSKRYKTKNITFGRFMQLLLLNKLYKSDCGHLLFYDHKFIILIDQFTITFHLANVTVFNILPQFDTRLYNSQVNTLNPIHTVLVPNDMLICDGIGIYFPVNNSIISVILRNECNKIYHWVKQNYKNLLSGDLVGQIPCICTFLRVKNIDKVDNMSRSQWVKEIKGLDFTTFLLKYEKHSSINIELNPKLRDKIKQTLNKGVPLHTCDKCGMELYATISDIEILNWIYIIVGIVKELMSKIAKVKVGVNYIKQFFSEMDQFYTSLTKFESNLPHVFVQIFTHILYAKYYCPRDPIQIFTIIKSFYISYYSLFEQLLYNYRKISHIDHVSNFKFKECDDDVIIQYSSAENFKYVKINQGNFYSIILGIILLLSL
ncbi:hypothetical protein TpMuguga_02g00055 [Theileria parva strain Muguga]|uniref:Uncharacterized protein n=1 Tax=Theileria parva TaxID=5875 RepID=Q4N682_THEPA|nr:uncharacterized protein TpMuguga_02g00055 [Theileria parva strain Muguga]EAN32341.1 hypothetical protein TpMuguga_02g00055 [Theileria parva strain Muguga]|eukprot:XP_764624.1 hypothetical protein [Theileria parva strain Muguga]